MRAPVIPSGQAPGTVFLILIIAGLVQVVLNQWLISSQVDDLVDTAGSSLEASSRDVSASFGDTREDVRQRLQLMQQRTTEELAGELTRQQTAQQERVASNVWDAVMAEAQGLADVLAAVAAPLIWDRDVPRLTELIELANARESVLFAVNRVLDAASRDPNVVIVTADIKPKGTAIGQLRMGLSLEGINRDLTALEEEFSATISGSIDTLRETLEAETGQVNQRAGRYGG